MPPTTPLTPEATLVTRARMMLLGSIVVTLGLYLVPHGDYIAYPLLLISTVVHELGHGIAAVLAGGQFLDFKMWSDGSGLARAGAGGDLGQAFVSAGGLCGPAVLAALFFVAGRTPKWSRYALAGFGGALVLAMLLVVRNGFGLGFIGALAAVCLVIAIWGRAEISQLAIVFLAVQLALSVYSRGDYLFMQYAETSGGSYPSDTENMARSLALPYWFWGGICAAFSAAVLAGGSWFFMRGARQAAGLPSPRAVRAATKAAAKPAAVKPTAVKAKPTAAKAKA